jgi:hypothetical protein
MIGYQLVILWIVLFVAVIFPFVKHLDVTHRLIIFWSIMTIFVFLFEIILMFKSDYVCDKGQQYMDANTCYWSENDINLSDMFSTKMYMDLYADYSLGDAKYRQNYGDSGFHFVMFGEILHGIFAGLLSILTLYYYYTAPDTNFFYLSVLCLGLTQLVMIIWYISPCILEFFVETSINHSSKCWTPPLLLNLPWFIIPPILIRFGATNILYPVTN